MIPVSRPVSGHGRRYTGTAGHRYRPVTRPVRPGTGGAPYITAPLPFSTPSGTVFAGMDPSDPSTYVRRWNPVPGMIGRLNFNGAAVQGNTDTGGVYSNPASWNATVGGRPRRRPR